jgi:hypothetical protein
LSASNPGGSGQYALTKVPAPLRVSTNPSASRVSNARSTVLREIPNCSLRARVPGSLVPGARRPLVIEVLISPMICACSEASVDWSNSMDNCMARSPVMAAASGLEATDDQGAR